LAKVVQTELEEEEYKRFKTAIKHKGISVKEAVKAAIASWTSSSLPLETEDPFFKLEPADFGDPALSKKVDEILYGRKTRK